MHALGRKWLKTGGWIRLNPLPIDGEVKDLFRERQQLGRVRRLPSAAAQQRRRASVHTFAFRLTTLNKSIERRERPTVVLDTGARAAVREDT